MTRTNEFKYLAVQANIPAVPADLQGQQLYLYSSSETVTDSSLDNCEVVGIKVFTNQSIEIGGEILSDPDELKKIYLYLAKWKSQEEYNLNAEIEWYIQCMPLLELQVDGSMNGYELPVNFPKIDLEKSYITFAQDPVQSSIGKDVLLMLSLKERN